MITYSMLANFMNTHRFEARVLAKMHPDKVVDGKDDFVKQLGKLYWSLKKQTREAPKHVEPF